MGRKMWASLLAGVLLYTAQGLGQSSNLSDVVGIPQDAATYQIPGLGFVNLRNGNLHIQLPLRIVKDRNSAPLTTSIGYDNSIWYIGQQTGPNGNPVSQWSVSSSPYVNNWVSSLTFGPSPNYSTSVAVDAQPYQCGNAQITQYANFQFTDGNGTIHSFPAGLYTEHGDGTGCPDIPNVQAPATDGSGYWLEVTNYASASVYDISGNRYGGGTTTDANGNSNGSGYKDKLDRSMQLPSGFSSTTKTIHVWSSFNYGGVAEIGPASAAVLSTLTLPDGREYTFDYDDAGDPAQQGHYGSLTGITLPTGGHITIESEALPEASYGSYTAPFVVKQINTPDGTWTFNYQPGGSVLTVAQAPVDPVTGLASQTTFSGISDGGTGSTVVSIYPGAATGMPSRKITTQPAIGPPTTITTALDNGQSSHVDYTYVDQCTPRIQTKKEYGYAGTLLRETDVTYLTSASDNTNLCRQYAYSTTGAPSWSSPYLQGPRHIVAIPASVTVYGSGGATSTLVAQTNYTYDSTPLSTTSGTQNVSILGLPLHDDANFGSGMVYRGNPTVISQLSTSGSFINTSTRYYNILGEVVRAVDANNNATNYDFTDSWGDAACAPSPLFAYPTTVTNALGQLTKSTYNSCDGSVASVKDQNNLTAGGSGTTYLYDGLQRVTSANDAAGGQTTTNYGTGVPEVVTTTTLATPDPTQISTKTLDGLGRTVTSVAPDNTTVVTTYDEVGRVGSVTNPHAPGDTEVGVTRYYYDALGRSTKRTNPDGTNYSWTYTGNVTALTDENNHQSQQTTDGLGRLIAVTEANGATTSYGYDVLGNILNINQPGVSGDAARTRSFVFDGLSRLMSATNPESGTVQYTYYPNGNLQTRTDARNITETFSYDALNRPTSETFSGGDTTIPTPPVTFDYDTGPSGGNTVGHLADEFVGSRSQPYALASFPQYDLVGRVKAMSQCVLQTCPSTGGTTTFSYDAAGNQVASSNGIASSPISIGYSYDVANRLKTVTSSVVPDAAHPDTLFSADVYGPLGLKNASYGVNSQSMNTAFTEQLNYDPRARIVSDAFTGGTATNATGSITIAGSVDQSTVVPGTPTSSSVQLPITGSLKTYQACQPNGTSCHILSDLGTVTLTVNGYAASANYTTGSTPASVAQALMNSVNSSGAPVVASLTTSTTIRLDSTMTGADGVNVNYALVTSGTINEGGCSKGCHSTPDFLVQLPNPPEMAGGGDGFQTVYDTGTISAMIGSSSASVSFGQNSTSTTIAGALQSALQAIPGSGVTAHADGDVVYLTSTTAGSNGAVPVTVSSTYDTSHFSSGSFDASASGLAILPGGGSLYSYNITNTQGQSGYDGVGNVIAMNDSVMGQWGYGYDILNRLTSANAATGLYSGMSLSWGIDSFGNRMNQQAGSINMQPPESTPAYTYSQTATNRPDQLQGQFDASGDLSTFGFNSYKYDGLGRICAVQAEGSAGGAMTGYLYNAEGIRVAKGNLSSFTCDMTQNGFSPYAIFVLSPDNEQVSQLDGAGNWQHTNVFADAKLLATYDPNGLHFALADFVGTKRIQASGQAASEEMCSSLPYGDSQICNGPDATKHHFTGKERDDETELNYFAARYLSSLMGRWMTPDRSDDPDPVPYADFTNPQSLNLYAYVLNNPLSSTDPDGHGCKPDTTEEFAGSNGNNVDTVVVNAGDCTSNFLTDIVNNVADISRKALQTVTDLRSQTTRILNTPGGADCLGALAANGAAAGAVSGSEVGLVGLAGGGVGVVGTEAAAVTVGGIGGAASGFVAGLTICPGGAAFSGNGGGEDANNTAQAKKLTPGEIAKLKENGIDVEIMKEEIGITKSSKSDLYKLPNGDIVVKGKGGIGPGEPTGININNLEGAR